jgi:RsiW-degrading membrane proteinase PrsW (M82 family)
LYIFHPELGGLGTALIRAALSVPAHALFAVTTGYFFTMAKFNAGKRSSYLIKAFAAAWLLHGVYDFLLLSGHPVLIALFAPFMVLMWRGGFIQMKKHLDISPFKRKEKA